jgi:hypothetical protein
MIISVGKQKKYINFMIISAGKQEKYEISALLKCLTPEDGTDRFFRNVGTELTFYAA